MAVLRFTTKIAGISGNVHSVTLCDPTGVYGIKSTGVGATKVAAETPMVLESTGNYIYTYTEDQDFTSYTAWIKCTQEDQKISYHEIVWTSSRVMPPSSCGTKLIPQATVDVLRSYTNVILNAFGITVLLYIPKTATYDAAEASDAYSVPADYTYDAFTANCWIEWGPSTYRLKKLGLYTEDEVPLVIWLPNKDVNGTAIDPVIRSYIRMVPQYIPSSITGVEEFELVNTSIRGMHDAIVLQSFAGVPRRVET